MNCSAVPSLVLVGGASHGRSTVAATTQLALPMTDLEANATIGAVEQWAEGRGYARIVGVDEVGRGALVGPVVAAAAWVPPAAREQLLEAGLRDSKRLTARRRERLARLVHDVAAVALGEAAAAEIDRTDIRRATFEAMRRALWALCDVFGEQPDLLLVDGRERIEPPPWPGVTQLPVVGGDDRSVSIAAASVVAKVHRDAIMVAYEARFPGYGFARHKGYGTAAHREALARLGPSPEHRHSFAPVRAAAEQRRT